MASILTEADIAGVWSIADELLLQFEISRAEPLNADHFATLAARVTEATTPSDDMRRSAIALGVASMRIALGERFISDSQKQQPEQTC